MQQVGRIAIVVGIASLVVGVISRWTITPVIGVEAHAFLDFTKVCFLFAIAMFLIKPARS